MIRDRVIGSLRSLRTLRETPVGPADEFGQGKVSRRARRGRRGGEYSLRSPRALRETPAGLADGAGCCYSPPRGGVDTGSGGGYHGRMISKCHGLIVVASAVFTALLPTVVRSADFSRYQIIIDRKPFGEPRAAVQSDPSNPNARLLPNGLPANSWITELRLCAITESGSGLRVGIENTKTVKSYLFSIGDTLDEITLVDADFTEECALLRKGTEEFWLSIRGDANAQGESAASGGTAVAGTSGAGVVSAHQSYADRLRKRREAIRTREVEPPKMTEQELEQHLMQYQMDLIRAGGENGPPLPIPLTPEMDDQLVSEGVLPPVE